MFASFALCNHAIKQAWDTCSVVRHLLGHSENVFMGLAFCIAGEYIEPGGNDAQMH